MTKGGVREMNKELEAMQSALNEIDFYIWDFKETIDFEKQAEEQIEIIQNGIDNLESALERKEQLETENAELKAKNEKLEKFYNIAVSKHVNLWVVSIYEYVSPYNYFRDEDEQLTDEEFKFLKEMLEDEENLEENK